MDWLKGKGRWFFHAACLAAEVVLAVDWASTSEGLLSTLSLGAAEYIGAMFFFACCAVIAVWEPINDLRPARAFKKLHIQIVSTRDVIALSTKGNDDWDQANVYTSVAEMRHRLGKLGIEILDWKDMKKVQRRIDFVKFLTLLGSHSEFSEIREARKLSKSFKGPLDRDESDQ